MTLESRPLARMKSWFKQLVEAVAFVHDNNLIHRDIKACFYCYSWIEHRYINKYPFIKYSFSPATFCLSRVMN